MSNSMLALVAAAALFTGSPQDGEGWLHEAESRLYSWPKPGAVIRFQVKTDVLDKTIEMLKKQLPPNPDAAAVKAIDALRRIQIHGMVDTETGQATTEVELAVDISDPNRKAGVERVKQGITTMVTKSFEALPFHDTSMAGADGKVLEASESGDRLTVKVSGKVPGEDTLIFLDRRKMLPEVVENGGKSMKIRYTEVLPGKFAPARLDIEAPGTPKSTAAFTYQRVGELVFPSTVIVDSNGTKAKLQFLSVRLDRRAP